MEPSCGCYSQANLWDRHLRTLEHFSHAQSRPFLPFRPSQPSPNLLLFTLYFRHIQSQINQTSPFRKRVGNMFTSVKLAAWAITLLSLINNADAFWRLQCFGRLGTAMMDPIVSPGTASSHEHTVKGGSGTYCSPFTAHLSCVTRRAACHRAQLS